jgi:hypothetical protein
MLYATTRTRQIHGRPATAFRHRVRADAPASAVSSTPGSCRSERQESRGCRPLPSPRAGPAGTQAPLPCWPRPAELSIVDFGVGHDQAGPDRSPPYPAGEPHPWCPAVGDPHDDGRVFGPPNGWRRERTAGNKGCRCCVRPVSATTSSTRSGEGNPAQKREPRTDRTTGGPTPASFTCTRHAIKLCRRN